MSCCTIKTINIPQCVSTIVMPVGLAEGIYTTTLTDKFNNKYNVDFPVDSEGNLTIERSFYPVGLLTKYAGQFTLEVYEGCERKDIVQCDTEYGVVAFKFFGSDNTGVSPYTDSTTYTVCC